MLRVLEKTTAEGGKKWTCEEFLVREVTGAIT
jgi:hypothetical protein